MKAFKIFLLCSVKSGFRGALAARLYPRAAGAAVSPGPGGTERALVTLCADVPKSRRVCSREEAPSEYLLCESKRNGVSLVWYGVNSVSPRPRCQTSAGCRVHRLLSLALLFPASRIEPRAENAPSLAAVPTAAVTTTTPTRWCGAATASCRWTSTCQVGRASAALRALRAVACAKAEGNRSLLWGETRGFSLLLLAAPRDSLFSLPQAAHPPLKLCCTESCSCRRKSNGRRGFRYGTGNSVAFMTHSPLALVRTINPCPHTPFNKTLPG